MEPKALSLQVGKFYRSRDGRIWEVVEKVPEGFKKETDCGETFNEVYCIWAICYKTKTFNSFATNGRSNLLLNQSNEDLVEELYGVFVHGTRIQFKSADEKKFVRYDGRLFCVDQSDNICTYLYEEMPKEIKHQHNTKISGVVLEHFTYEYYCKFYGIEPAYTKKLTPDEEFDNFVKSCKDGEWSKSLGCQKEAAVEFLIAYKSLMKAMGKFSDDVKSYPKCLIREVFKDYPEYAKFELPTMFKKQDGKDFTNFAGPLVDKMKKILN